MTSTEAHDHEPVEAGGAETQGLAVVARDGTEDRHGARQRGVQECARQPIGRRRRVPEPEPPFHHVTEWTALGDMEREQ